jgi:hypothetical protein
MPMRAHPGVTAVRMGIVALLLAGVGTAGGRQFLSPRHGASGLRAEAAPTTATWAERLALVDEALERRDVSQAIYRWRDAYGAALRSRSWEPLLAAGDRAERIDGMLDRQFRPEARSAYLAALLSARRQRSAAGVLGAADGLERLGDVEAATAARRMVPAGGWPGQAYTKARSSRSMAGISSFSAQ